MRLHWRLMSSCAGVVALVLLSLGLFLGSTLRSFLVDLLADRLSRDARLAADLWTADLRGRSLDELADRIGQRLGARVTLVAGDGSVLGDSDVDYEGLGALENHAWRPEIAAARGGAVGRAERYSHTLQSEMLYLARPAATSGAVVRLAMPLVEVGQLQRHIRYALLIGSVLGLVVAVALAYITARHDSRSVVQIIDAARSMAAGSFAGRVRVPRYAARELADLAHALQAMHGQLQERVNQASLEQVRLRAIISSVAEGILVTDPEGRVLLANAAVLEMFGTPRWHEGMRPIELIRSDKLGEAVDRTLRTGKETRLEISLPGPPERHVEVHVAPVTHGDQQCGSVTGFHDITRLRRLETVRKDFVANVSHELRTPLTAIKGYAETLLGGALDDRTNAGRFVGVIAAHADRLTTLLRDLLDLSRLESDQLELERAPFAVRTAVESALEPLAQLARQKQITTEVRVEPGLTALGDARLVEQALLNLADNAIKYTAEGGSVVISAGRMTRQQAAASLAARHWSSAPAEPDDGASATQDATDVVMVEVTDSGIGIPSDAIERVFERFYRVDKGRSRAVGGTGLGLSIVRHAVQAHGERLFVDSELGKGSTFGFTLPAG